MPELFITDDQDAFLEELRAEIANDVVGQYGRVRKQDALQYLIDNSLDGLDLEVDPEGVDYDPDEVEDHVDEPAPEATDGGAVTEPPAGDGSADGSSADAEAGAATTGADGADAADAGGDGAGDDGTARADAAAGDDADDGGATGGGPTPSGGGDDMMDAMLNLLDEHDDKWRKADTAETKYEVELPDGDTETVQTKDDVKAVLFKQY